MLYTMVANGKVARRKGDFFASKSQVFGLAAPFSLLPASDRAGRAQARHPRTALSPLLPTLYFLGPHGECRAGRAQARHPRTSLSLLPPPSSLLSYF